MWQFKSVSHLHLVAMKAVDVGQNFLVGEFRVTGKGLDVEPQASLDYCWMEGGKSPNSGKPQPGR